MMRRREPAAVIEVRHAEIPQARNIPIGDETPFGAEAATMPPLESAATEPI